MATTERPEPVAIAPGVETRADVQGGEPVIVGTRLTTSAAYGVWRAEGMVGARAAFPSAPYEGLTPAVCFEAGRRYERAQAARDKRCRWVGSINDADAHRAQGRREGLAAAADYLRATGRGDWAVVLTETLKERERGDA